MEFGLKWVHMARYQLILLDKTGRSHMAHDYFQNPLTPKRAMESSKIRKKVKNLLELAKFWMRTPGLELLASFWLQIPGEGLLAHGCGLLAEGC